MIHPPRAVTDAAPSVTHPLFRVPLVLFRVLLGSPSHFLNISSESSLGC